MMLTVDLSRSTAPPAAGQLASGSPEHARLTHLKQDDRLPGYSGVERQIAYASLTAFGLQLGPPLIQPTAVKTPQTAVQTDLLRRAGLAIQQAQLTGERRLQLVRRQEMQHADLMPTALEFAQTQSDSIGVVKVGD